MTDKPALIYTTFGSSAEAHQVARTLLDEQLIACANHLAPAVSQYVWEGELCEEREYPVLLKTMKSAAKAAMARVKALHSYDTPAITCWSADDSDADYAKWLAGQIAK